MICQLDGRPSGVGRLVGNQNLHNCQIIKIAPYGTNLVALPLRRILMLNTGIFSYCENLSIFVSNHPFKFLRKRPVCEYFTSFFQWDVKRRSGCYMHNRGCRQNVDPPFWIPFLDPLSGPPSGPPSGPLSGPGKRVEKDRK